MKILRMLPLLLLALAINKINIAQNTYPWPTGGNIGIGTTSPDYLFTVNGSSHLVGDLIMNRADGFGASIVVDNTTTNSIYLQKVGGGNIDVINLLGSFIGLNGNVGIGTFDTKGYQLAVNGKAIFTTAVVKLYPNWPDYVFKKDYHLPSLDSVAQFIQANHHLPDMPSADSVVKNGLDLGGNQAALLKKVEELTLYVIDLNKKNELLQQQIGELKAPVDKNVKSK